MEACPRVSLFPDAATIAGRYFVALPEKLLPTARSRTCLTGWVVGAASVASPTCTAQAGAGLHPLRRCRGPRRFRRNTVAIDRTLVLIPLGAGVGNDTTLLAASLQAELMTLGFVMERPALEAARTAPRDWLVTYFEEVVP